MHHWSVKEIRAVIKEHKLLQLNVVRGTLLLAMNLVTHWHNLLVWPQVCYGCKNQSNGKFKT